MADAVGGRPRRRGARRAPRRPPAPSCGRTRRPIPGSMRSKSSFRSFTGSGRTCASSPSPSGASPSRSAGSSGRTWRTRSRETPNVPCWSPAPTCPTMCPTPSRERRTGWRSTGCWPSTPRGSTATVRTERISMCGVMPATVVLFAARRLGATSARLIRYATSGDVSRDFDQVVGYAGLAFAEALPSLPGPTPESRTFHAERRDALRAQPHGISSTSAAPAPPSSTSSTPATPAASSSCGSRTPTRSGPPPRRSRRSSTG